MTQIKPNTNLVGAVAICFAAVLLTTMLIWTIGHFRPTEHLMLVYVLLTILIAIYFGGILACLTAIACGLAAAYFLLPPQFSLYVDDPAHVNELFVTMMVAVIAAAGIVELARGQTNYSSWLPP